MIGRSIKPFQQERLAKDDIKLLIDLIAIAREQPLTCSDTRLELLIGKLKRMEKQ